MKALMSIWGAAVLVVGIVLGVLIAKNQSPRILVPYRHGDVVIVKSGFMAGKTGKLISRDISQYDGLPIFRIDFDGDGIGDYPELKEDEFVLVGDWNSTKLRGRREE